MINQFIVAPELQQFLTGVSSKSLTNVIWDVTFPGTAPVLPTNPNSVRRILMFDKQVPSNDATPRLEYNCFIENLDGSRQQTLTTAREI